MFWKSWGKSDAPKTGTVATKDYWNKAFSPEGEFAEPNEWMARWQDLREDIEMLLPNKATKVLVPGCGNAPFNFDMYDAGYERMVCGDFSDVVIRNLKNTPGGRKIQWDLMDAAKMPYPDGSFEAVIDKGLFDTLRQSEGSQTVVAKYAEEVNRVLARGGVFIAVTQSTDTAMKSSFPEASWRVTCAETYKTGAGDDPTSSTASCNLMAFMKTAEVAKSEGASMRVSSRPSFLVQYSPSCDGGTQERDAAARFIKECYPDAQIETKCVNGAHRVSISGEDGKEIVSVPQRDMYRKYQWPAKDKIKSSLKKAIG